MKILFFSLDDNVHTLVGNIDHQSLVATDDVEQALELASEARTLVFIDLDEDKKKAEKLNVKLMELDVIRIVMTESIKLKELKKHQKGKSAADGYVRKPLNLKIINEILNDFEVSDFIQEEKAFNQGDSILDAQVSVLRAAEEGVEKSSTTINEDETETDLGPPSNIMKLDDRVVEQLAAHMPNNENTPNFATPLNMDIQDKFDAIFDRPFFAETDEEVSDLDDISASENLEDIEIDLDEGTSEIDFGVNISIDGEELGEALDLSVAQESSVPQENNMNEEDNDLDLDMEEVDLDEGALEFGGAVDELEIDDIEDNKEDNKVDGLEFGIEAQDTEKEDSTEVSEFESSDDLGMFDLESDDSGEFDLGIDDSGTLDLGKPETEDGIEGSIEISDVGVVLEGIVAEAEDVSIAPDLEESTESATELEFLDEEEELDTFGEETNPTIVMGTKDGSLEEFKASIPEATLETEFELSEELEEDPLDLGEDEDEGFDSDATVTEAIEAAPTKAEELTPEVTISLADEAPQMIITPDDQRIAEAFNQTEQIRLQATIKQLREERESLLKEIHELKIDTKLGEQDRLGIQAELDETKIEVQILKKRSHAEVDELKYQLRLSEEKRQIYDERSRSVQKEFDRLNQKVRIDINQVKQREKELESQLELITMDSQGQVKSRDGKILELKRKIDALEFNMENASIRELKSREDKEQVEDRLEKIMRTLRGSLKSLESDSIGSTDRDSGILDKIDKL